MDSAPPPICPACGHRNRGAASFCSGCGGALVRTCPGCGAEQPGSHAFCDACGADIRALAVRAAGTSGDGGAGTGAGASAAARAAAGLEAAPLEYTPQHLVEKILQQRSALEGERKQVTVLFVDVKGSLELSESTDPEQWHHILDGFFQILAEGVHRFEGTINQYTGDGIMALFGAPIAHEDHAQRACRAALHVLEQLREYGRRLRMEHGVNFAVRVGMNSGDVVVGAIGDDLRMDYTAQGHTVGLAARVEQITEPGRAYLTEHTARLVRGFFDVADLGKFSLKGSEPIPIFELRGLGALRTRLDLSRARGLTRFVGRHRELAEVGGALERARANTGTALGIVGEAGVGKSRMCGEALTLARAAGFEAIEMHCPAHGRALDLAPVCDLLRGLLDIPTGESPREARRKVAGELLLHDESLGKALPLVLDLLGIAEPGTVTGDPQSRRRRLIDVVAELVCRRARRVPLLLVIDDLHWIDPSSESFLGPVAEAVIDSPVLLLANFRPEYSERWEALFGSPPLQLAPLAGNEFDELLERLLGPDPSVRELPARIRAHTAGNPLFVEELVQSLLESGALEGERGAYGLARPVDAIEVPSSIGAIVAGRIDRLSERDKRVLHSAAVIGKEFSRDLLERVAEVESGELDAALAALESAEFIAACGDRADDDWEFRHPLTQEVAYSSQLRDRRARVHAAIAALLTGADSETDARRAPLLARSVDQPAALIAHHLERSGDEIAAGDWHLQAAHIAQQRDCDAATHHLRRAMELADRAGGGERALALGASSRTGLLLSGGMQGIAKDEAERLLAEGRRCVEHLPPGGERFMLLSGYGLSCIFGGDFAEALDVFEEADEIARASDARVLGLASSVSLSYAQLMLGQLREGVATLDPLLAALESDPDLDRAFSASSPGSGSVLQLRASMTSRMGRLDEALADLERAIDYACERGIPDWEAMGLATRAELAVMRGDAEPALRDAWAALRMGRRITHTTSIIAAWTALGEAQALSGHFGEARTSLEAALEASRSSGNIAMETRITRELAHALVACGEPDEGLAMARGAVTVAALRGARVHEIAARLGLARVALDVTGPCEEAEQCMERARVLIEGTSARLYEPELDELRARCARDAGDDAGARAALVRACNGYRENGAVAHTARVAALL